MTIKNTVNDIKRILETVVLPRLDRCFEKEEAYSHFDRLYNEYERFNQEIIFTTNAVRTLEDDRATKAEVKNIENRVINLEQKVSTLEQSLGDNNS